MKANGNTALTPEQFVLRRKKRHRRRNPLADLRSEKRMIKRILRTRITAKQLIESMLKADISLGAIAKSSGISATTLRLHVHRGQPMSPKNAMLFAEWSGGQVSAVKMFMEGQVA